MTPPPKPEPDVAGQQAAPPLKLAEAMAALICHDLSGPLGTLLTALELAQDEPAAAEEAMLLAREATDRMAKRLRLMRTSWGGASGAMSRAAFVELVAGLPVRTSVAMDGLRGQEFDGHVARVLLNAVMLGAEALPRGGMVALAGDVDDGMTVLPVGRGAAWPPHLSLGLLDPESCACDDPREVQAPFFGYLARAAGMRATLLLPLGAESSACPPLLLSRLT